MNHDAVFSDWQAQIKAAAARQTAIRIQGSGSKARCLPALPAASERTAIIDSRAYSGIVEYEPNELVIVVRAGTPLTEVEAQMRAAGQVLAFEPPHWGPGATIGGTVATNLSGPRRPYAGAVRDFVLGLRVLDGKGDDLRFGGKVMKNVAGFDVSRLLCGSQGSLAVIAEVALKCLPAPNAEQTQVLSLSEAEAIKLSNTWYSQALPITGSVWVSGQLYLRLAGAEPAVRSAVQRIGGDTLSHATDWWRDWREQTHAFFVAGEGLRLYRVSCAATAPLGLQTYAQAIDWAGAQRWLQAPLDAWDTINDWAKRHGGHVELFASASTPARAATVQQAALHAIQQRIKTQFDPYSIFPSHSSLV